LEFGLTHDPDPKSLQLFEVMLWGEQQMRAPDRAEDGAARRVTAACRWAILMLALAVTFTVFAAPPAAAQSPAPFNWFQQLFRPQRPAYYPPPEPRYAPGAGERRRHVVRVAPKPVLRTVEKKPDKPEVLPSFFVAVMGDSLGQLLGQGLVEAFSEQPEVAILRKARESSGLVRNDFYDWSKGAQDILAGSDKVDVAVILIGSNDHQPLRDGTASYEPHSPKWTEIYTARIEGIAKQFQDKKIPLIWVGLPIMKSDRMSKEALALNELYKEYASKAGATYVDIWEAFGNERGVFAASGPDVQGQVVKLRSADGVHFTKAGARKLAHFVEDEIKRVLDATEPEDDSQFAKLSPAAPQTGEVPAAASPDVVSTKPPIGPVLPLTASPISSDGSLVSRASADVAAQAQIRVEKAFGGAALQPKPIDPKSAEPKSVEVKPGRADDFSWPR
jgi:hypothetical protein